MSTNGKPPRRGAADSVGVCEFSSNNAAELSPSPTPTQAAAKPVFVIRLQATRPGAAIRGLRWILKALGRTHGFRCLSVGLDRGAP
jgi:hypothetical protein